jgi:DNA-binding transcriptional MerR regulator
MQRQAAVCLGVSEQTLQRWRSASLLKPGDHFRRKYQHQHPATLLPGAL